MPHIPLDVFPHFDLERLTPIRVLPTSQPSLQKARAKPGIYLEAPFLRSTLRDDLNVSDIEAADPQRSAQAGQAYQA
jgi:hypothetical protein